MLKEMLPAELLCIAFGLACGFFIGITINIITHIRDSREDYKTDELFNLVTRIENDISKTKEMLKTENEKVLKGITNENKTNEETKEV